MNFRYKEKLFFKKLCFLIIGKKTSLEILLPYLSITIAMRHNCIEKCNYDGMSSWKTYPGRPTSHFWIKPFLCALFCWIRNRLYNQLKSRLEKYTSSLIFGKSIFQKIKSCCKMKKNSFDKMCFISQCIHTIIYDYSVIL
jgi:hypothetical protein